METGLWYKNAILYELHVRAFYDSNGDGIGDFPGLTQKLDYLQNLGVTALWLLPFYPSPLKDDGYDIADYQGIHPAYGTLADFRKFLREAHRRGLRVVTELVLNHTSDQHPWFQRARRARSGSREREFYVWSDSPDRYREARVIFKDFEKSNWTWDPVAREHYWHRFYAHQPDLNYENPEVRKAVTRAADFWLGMGVDGLRLDAVPYLIEREGTTCENLPETHAVLKELRRHVDGRFRNRMLLAEANQWPEDAAAYFGGGKECHMAFHFPVMPRLFMAIRMEDRFPIVDILQQTPQIPPGCQWALFLRNHDELTLEMVTDEDRDYMVRAYAQDPEARLNLGIRRRLAPLLGNHRRKIELMTGLLFSLPGTPILYYGDEIGMGDNVRLPDRAGVRTPMQWSSGGNAGFSRANPRRMYLPVITDPEYHFQVLNVELQEQNPHSLLWQTRRMVALRKQYRAFGEGSMELLQPENGKVLAFVRQHGEETLLVVANLSRFVQQVDLPLGAWRGLTPVELFGATRFPAIGGRGYPLTLGPHTFYWFSLERTRPRVAEGLEPPAALPTLTVRAGWEELVRGRGRRALEEALPAYLRGQRWFGAKSSRIKGARVEEAIPLRVGGSRAYLLLVQVRYADGEPERYLLPVSFLPAGPQGVKADSAPAGSIAQVRAADGERSAPGVLRDALGDPGFCRVLLAAMARGRWARGDRGELWGQPTLLLRRIKGSPQASLEPVWLGADQSNSSVAYGKEWMLKLYRGLGEGTNPELEVLEHLGRRGTFTPYPALGGFLEYRAPGRPPSTLAILQRFVPNEGDAWEHTLDVLGRFFEQMLAGPRGKRQPGLPRVPWLDLLERDPPPAAREAIGAYLDSARQMGQLTAEFHLAVAEPESDPVFGPEPFGEIYQRSLYQGMRSSAAQTFQTLRRRYRGLPPAARREAAQLVSREPQVAQVFEPLLKRRVSAMRIRCHGDLHLAQFLHTGKDFVMIDFEGEPARSFGERRIKRSPLSDVAGMLRSFDYAAHAALLLRDAGQPVRPEDQKRLEVWARFWRLWVCVAFLQSYLRAVGRGDLLPRAGSDLRLLLRAFLMEKAIYEIRYELDHRPGWVTVPLRGALLLLEENP